MGARTDDVAQVMESEIEIQRKLVFDSMMMVKSAILAKLKAATQHPSAYAIMKIKDDGEFFLKVAGDQSILDIFTTEM